MAYIYRYHWKKAALRKSLPLTKYTEGIQTILKELFNNNLKDSFVDEKYFEFKLYETVNKRSLQEMGRVLKKETV